MRKWIKQFVFVSAACAVLSAAAFAQDVGAVNNGDWSNGSIWTSGTVPGSSNNVYIGSTYPTGSALTATVTVSVNESASSVYLGGDGGATSGTLDLTGGTLTVGTNLLLGYYGGTGAISESGGSFTAANVYIGNGNSLNFGASDVASNLLYLTGASTATTAATANLATSVDVYGGSVLNLGANLNLSSTLDVEETGSIVHMNGNNISAGTILLGWYDSQAVTLDRGTTPGSLTATNLYVYGSTLNLLTTDSITNFSLSAATTTLNSGVTVSSLNLYSGSTGTTTTSGNITGNVNVESGSTLNLGANLNLPGASLDVENTGSIVHMNGNNISAGTILLGWYDSQAVTLDRGTTPGSLTATNLYVYGSTLNLLSTDNITNFSLSAATTTLNSGVTVSSLNLYSGSTGTTTTAGNITGNVNVESGSTLNLGANLTLPGGTLDVENTGSIVHMNGKNISADTILLGWYDGQAVTLDRGTTPGSLTATNLYLAANTLNLLPTDSITNFSLSGATTTLNSGVTVSSLNLYNGSTGTTTTVGNITGNVNVESGSTLNLGANLNLPSGSLDIENTGSVVHMNGNNISAQTILVGWYDGQAVTLDRGTTPGSLTATNLYVGGNTLNLLAADSTSNLYLSNATVTTAATSNVTSYVEVDQGSTLHLGANLSVSSALDILNGSTVNAHGFGITAPQLTVGYFGTSAASLINTGLVNTNYLYLGNGSALTLHGGDVVNDAITLVQGSTLTVQQTNGTGLTLNGAFSSALTIDPSSMDLIFNLNTGSNWDFRWADPTSGNWISTLDTMIAAGQINVTAPQGYSVVDQSGYTYIMGGFSTVPEPSSLVLACIAGVGMVVGVNWQRRRTGC